MKTILSFLIGMLLTFQLSYAQQVHIKGKIYDAEDKTPVGYATVSLLRPDSTFITGLSCDENGMFDIINTAGNYLLSISYVGYEKSYTSVECLKPETYIEFPLKPSSITLKEVTVAAKSVINKGDRKLILPSALQIKTSTDGLDLLRKMQLSRIMVDPLTGEVLVSGNGEVQLRKNGVLVTSSEISAINPEDIVRIEYHDDPGVRYVGASAVIDYITRRAESGGNIRGGIMNNIGGHRSSMDDILSAKFNHKKSEFSANAVFQKRKQDWIREYDEKFIFPDHEIHRTETGEPTPFNKSQLLTQFNYSLVEKDKYFFNAQFRYNYLDFPAAYEDRRSKLYTSDSDIPLSIYDHTKERTNLPALDLYFQKNLRNGQLLIFNLVGTYIGTKNTRVYQEERDNVMETDIYSDVKGRKYSLIGEGIYEKKLGQGKLTAGLKHLQAYTDNEYTGTTIADVSMRQAESNIYGEYQIKSGKFGYMLNVTGTRYYYSQEDNSREKYSLLPAARITFDPNKDLSFRYRIGLQNNNPSLAYVNDVEQAIDPLQFRRGNPALKSFRSLNQSFLAGYSKGICGVDLLVSYDYQYKPIMESVLYEDGLFVRTYENQKSFQNLAAELTLKIKPWKDHISLSVTPKVNRYISEGNAYLHKYTMGEIRINLDFSYKNFIANFSTITPPTRFVYGEQLNKGELMNNVTVGYKQPSWAVMMGIFCPFTKTYKADSENWAALNPVKSQVHTRNMTQMLFVKCNFNLNFGKQFRTGNKQLNNSDSDAGIISGTKN